MTIAGIKAEYDMHNLIEHPPAYVPHGIDLYTTEQVREILIKFADSVSVGEDVDYYFDEEEVTLRLMINGSAVDDNDSVVEAVDDFIKGIKQ